MFGFWRRAYAQHARRVRGYWKHLLDEGPAHARGECLLREWLSPAQRAQLDALGYFEVVGCHTRKKYRIRAGTSANIEELDDDGVPKMGWCFVPQGYLVQGDVMLAQKISLETDERAALAVANRFPAHERSGRHPQALPGGPQPLRAQCNMETAGVWDIAAPRTADVVIETIRGDRLGVVLREGSAPPLAGEPRPIEGIGRERIVYAPSQSSGEVGTGGGEVFQ